MPDEPRVPGVFIHETTVGTPPIRGVPTSETAFVDVFARGPTGRAVRVLSWADVERTFGGLDAGSEASYALRSYFVNGGAVAWIVRIDPVAGAWHAGAASRALAMTTALAQLTADREATFSLLCIPAAAALPAVEHATVVRAATACARTRYAMLLLDPRPQDAAAALAASIGVWEALRSPDAALFVPRLLVRDPLAGDRPRAIGPSGAVAGICARTDAARGIWKAPAGIGASVRGIMALAETIDRAVQASLNARAVNALRDVAPHGPVVWGSRTLDGADGRASEHRYLPARRLVRWIEASLVHGLAWTAFEPNDSSLHARIRGLVHDFLMLHFRQGAFAGDKPEHAFLVRCDRTTTTDADIAAGRVVLVVGIAPVKAAEFVMTTLVLRAMGV